MKKELHIFFNALMFFTRIPCPNWVDFSTQYLEKSTKYFPLIGIIVGAIVAMVFYISQLFLPVSISIVLSMAAGVLTTGAFHEDGLADVCDGFGGGWTKEKILEIMKDSRIGTFGMVGLTLVLLSKYLLSIELFQFSRLYFLCTILLGHTLSRLNATSVILLFKYAREDANSKTKPLAKSMAVGHYIVAFIIGIIPLILVSVYWSYYIFFILIPLVFLMLYLGRYFNKWIGGFTGDCLGSVQQVSELLIYIYMVAIWKFI